ncbi:MAG: hypothetical protein ACO3A4_03315 [Silvanigrellaceae bacterium]
MNGKQIQRNTYSFNTFGSRPIFRYLLVEHRDAFLQTLEGLQLASEDVLQGNRILTTEEQGSLFGLMCQLRASDKFIGFRSAKLHDIHDSGLPGILARSCGTIRELLDLHEKYYVKLDSEGVLAHLVLSKETLGYAFEKLAYAPFAIQEYALASTWVALTSLSPEVKSHVLTFEFPGTAEGHGLSLQDISDLEREFSTRLVFSAGRLALTLKIAVLEVAIPTVDPSLKLLLERKLRILTSNTLAEDTEELRSQVFTAVLELREASQPITIDAVAQYMGVKSEALSYALRSHGIQFQKLKSLVE